MTSTQAIRAEATFRKTTINIINYGTDSTYLSCNK